MKPEPKNSGLLLICAICLFWPAALVVLFLLSGCAGMPAERTFFYHEPSRGAAEKFAAEWAAADERRSVGVVANTGSMRPKFQPGDLLLLLRHDGAPVLPGQVVVFDRGDGVVFHRVLLGGGKTGSFFAKGDGVRQPDGWLPQSRIRSVVVGVITFPHEKPANLNPQHEHKNQNHR